VKQRQWLVKHVVELEFYKFNLRCDLKVSGRDVVVVSIHRAPIYRLVEFLDELVIFFFGQVGDRKLVPL